MSSIKADVLIDFHPQLHPCTIETFNHCDAAASDMRSQSFFLCGQYELDETSESGASRGGSIHICKVDSSDLSLSFTTTDCRSGVLDMKIAGDLVACAQSDHTLCLYKIQADDTENSCTNNSDHSLEHSQELTSFHLEEVATASKDDEGLFLSVDWDLGYNFKDIHDPNCKSEESKEHSGAFVRRKGINENNQINAKIAVSTQEGSILIYELSNEIELTEIHTINQAHTMCNQPMPAWIVCFNPHETSTIISGGDDCLMKLWDLRQGYTPTHVNKTHNAGVTSAQWHPKNENENIFATGSYDEYVRVWDNRALRVPLQEIHAGTICRLLFSWIFLTSLFYLPFLFRRLLMSFL